MTLDEALLVTNEPAPGLVALDEALQSLEQFDLRKSRVVEPRYFGGLSVEETALTLNVATDTVMRDWRLAKARLRRELAGNQAR